MVARSRTQDELTAALRAVDDEASSPAEKAEMLMEMAMGLQQKPKEPADIDAAVELYERAIELAEDSLLNSRIRARMGTALMTVPSVDTEPLEQARSAFEQALEVLIVEGSREEIAEAEMNLGLVLQNLAPAGKALIQDAIAAYQRALRVFEKLAHPREFAILQNNLATAFLSIPFTDEKAKMGEALAVQAFEEGLKVVSLIDHPSEYAMLQNNLGNALQYASSSHRVENGFRAIEAYDEALKVRDRRTTPGEYANTIANKANCLSNLPDDPADPEAGNPAHIAAAVALYVEAGDIFGEIGETEKRAAVMEICNELRALMVQDTPTKSKTVAAE